MPLLRRMNGKHIFRLRASQFHNATLLRFRFRIAAIICGKECQVFKKRHHTLFYAFCFKNVSKFAIWGKLRSLSQKFGLKM